MSIHAVPAQTDGQTVLGAALRRWSADPTLAALVAPGSGALLVLDGAAERVLHASESGAAWRSAVADARGTLHASLGLASQLQRLGALTQTPRVVRLRLDPRGIAPAVPCRVARAPFEDGSTAMIVAPLGVPRRVRAYRATEPAERPREPSADASAVEYAAQPVQAVPVGGRLVWRSDARGMLTHVSGAGTDLVAALQGQSWDVVCARSDDARARELLAALRDRQTFRALPLVVLSPDAASELTLDISGSPSGRANGVFTGFAGFAVIRGISRRAVSRTVSEPASAEAGETFTAEPAADAPLSEPASATRALPHPSNPPTSVDAPPTDPSEAADPEVGPDAAATKPTPDLSTDERVAFREIARALGARFADDTSQGPIPAPTGLPALGSQARSPTSDHASAAAVAAAFDGMPSGLLVHRDGALLFANRRLLDQTGFADHEALKRSEILRPLMAGSAAAGGEEPVAVTAGSGESIRFVAERSRLDWEGRQAELVIVRSVPESEGGVPIGQPLTDPAPVHDTPAVLNELDEGVVTLDADGHVLKLNPRAEAIVGDDAARIVGQRFAALVGPDRGTATAPSQNEDRTAEPLEVATPLAEGSATPLRVRIGRLLSSEESPLYATLQDMADAKGTDEDAAVRRRAEEGAQRKLAFFARTGRQVRHPLNDILGLADAMLSDEFGPLDHERRHDALRDIQASGGEALGLVDDLVEFAEVEAGRTDLAFTELPLNELVLRCIAELQPQAMRRRIVLRTSLADDLQALHADERSLRNAALKVLSNAIRLTEAGGQVIVSTTHAERGEVALRVRDTGSGMSPEEVDHALDPFRHPRLPDAHGRSGPGLGLSLTKALVEANRGRMRITSRKDEGTLVEMLFPPRAAGG